MAKRKASKPLEAPKAPVRAAAKQSAGTKRKSNDAAHPTPQKPAKAVKQEMQDCDICAESKPLYRHFPHVQSCDHDPTVCSDCYRTHFVTRIDADRALGWLACNCPLCAESVSEEDARGILPRTLSRELDRTIQQVRERKPEIAPQQKTNGNRHRSRRLSTGCGVQPKVVATVNCTH